MTRYDLFNITFAESHDVIKSEMNFLNRRDSPCDENGDQMNIEECIKTGIEKELNCTIPDMSSGEVLTPVAKITTSHLCSSKTEFLNYFLLNQLTGYTEKKLYENFSCIATCQEKLLNEMNLNTKIIT